MQNSLRTQKSRPSVKFCLSSRMDAKPTLTPMLLPARRPTRKVEALSSSPRSPRNSGNR
ncbi:hypothetical protein PGTUg99_024507 [Puccinia graminis f. sp. tritici]|uniref:Uncharacterized protein n=1 Tax=Puccinia graminis f. sp. tritici TaxID=56615 RepID=A0A5B0MYG3_PUCGR|nr:hypothetical protein PGTUg99_024507 [Puccinia graminis f. sp. tritici]